MGLMDYIFNMKIGTGRLSWIAMGLLLSLPPARALEQAAILKLEAGDAIVSVRPDPQGATGLIEAAIDIAVPPQKLWAVMLDCERAKRFIASLTSCRILEQSADSRSDVREHIVQWIWPLPAVRSVFRSSYTPYERIAFERIEGDLALMQGEWRLEPLRGATATRLFYRARITPGWQLPDGLVRAAIETDVPKTLTALRREATGRD